MGRRSRCWTGLAGALVLAAVVGAALGQDAAPAAPPPAAAPAAEVPAAVAAAPVAPPADPAVPAAQPAATAAEPAVPAEVVPPAAAVKTETAAPVPATAPPPAVPVATPPVAVPTPAPAAPVPVPTPADPATAAPADAVETATDQAATAHDGMGAKVTASSTHEGWEGEGPAGNLVDGDLSTRWSSEYAAPQEVVIELAEPLRLGTLRIHWEAAAATRYAVSVSADGKVWKGIHFYLNTGAQPAERIDEITVRGVPATVIKLDLQGRVNDEWGFSIYEVEILKAVN